MAANITTAPGRLRPIKKASFREKTPFFKNTLNFNGLALFPTVFLTKLVNPATGVDNFLFAGIKRMASRAHVKM
jgi:hypothetical protein